MPGITRRIFAASSVAAATSALLSPARAQAYPARPVTLIVPWGAGGGTDATARIVATLLEKELGQPFNVVNRTGGSGAVGHAEIAAAAPDGYTIGMLTVEIAMLHWQALTQLTPRNFTPLALVNEDPPGIQVSTSSPYKTAKELMDAIKLAPPGRFKASGTGQGGIWHLALVGWMQAMGLPANQVAWSAVEWRSTGHAGSRRRQHRSHHLLGAGGARHHRGRPGAEPRDHGARTQSDLP